MTLENREQIRKELEKARTLVHPHSRKIEDLSAHIDNEEFLESIRHLNRLTNILAKEPVTRSRSGALHLFSATSQKIPVGEIFRLLKDGYEGNLNRYLQEILSNATIGIGIVPQNSQDKNSREILEVKIQVAATAIDNYAGLLTMILGQSKFSKNQEKIIGKAHKAIKTSAGKFQVLRISCDLKELRSHCAQYMEEHAPVNCFSSFGCFSSRPSSQYKSLMDWFEGIRTEALAEQELIGAVYYIRANIDKISNKYERNALRDSLDAICGKYGYPIHTDTEVNGAYVTPFINRALYLGMDWPGKFQPDNIGQTTNLKLAV
ncbi:hypothetical protein [Legionella spiritensis]|uniref:hypothetical protein n=1 Tax=Legionella spiritensis TaxID=452 RepID=UPI000F717F58|nr:hypothetical protein [Legionella spiritensis]VEG91521.1 Uncharacterised protein [Legionella spiritensis]